MLDSAHWVASVSLQSTLAGNMDPVFSCLLIICCASITAQFSIQHKTW